MSTRLGRCTNFKVCASADQWQVIPIAEGKALVCPRCGEELMEIRDEPRDNRVKQAAQKAHISFKVWASVAMLLVGITCFAIWQKVNSAKAAGSGEARQTMLRLAGSNTIGDALGPALAEAFLKKQGASDVHLLAGANPEEKIVEGTLPGDSAPSIITITAHGSATAFTGMAANNCDIGMASRRIKPEEAATLASLGDMTAPASEHIVGLDGIAVIVNSANPIDQLDKDHIRQLFTGEIKDWSQAGPYAGAVKIYARNDNSGTYDTFKNLVLAGKPLAAGAQRIEDSQALSEAVAADPKAIGFIGLPYIQSAKPISVSDHGTLSLLPTRLTVGTEDYLFSRRLYLYTPANSTNKYARPFVEFALSKEGQDVVEANGFVAQNVVAQAQTVAENAPDEYKRLTKEANRLSLDFRFQSGQAALDNKAMVDLGRVVSLIADLKYSGDKIMLFGFADGQGDPRVNQALSISRAQQVANLFIQRGLKPAIIRGYSSGVAVASNDTEDGKAKNRRVEIWMRNN
jgi:phosphate transport system substrate-binding protein